MTFAQACGHIDNFTSAHESLMSAVGAARLAYPPGHIEVDNRLSWLLGRLAREFRDEDTFYVHLQRDEEATARSFQRRWGKGIIKAYSTSILSGAHRTAAPYEICLDYCRTVDANITEFLSRRPHSMAVRLATAEADFAEFWRRVGARGDLGAALAEWRINHNESDLDLR